MNNTEKYQGGFWPSEDDALLLKAILLPREEAIKAWEEWLKIVNIDTLEAGTNRMFPLLYAKLKEYDIKHPLMDKFKGIYRQTWYKNQMTFHHIVPLLKAFKNEGIETIVLKGAALTVLYYKDLGLRHMSDFDLMIAPPDVQKSLIILQNHGYILNRPTYTWESFDDGTLFSRLHGIGFKHRNSKQELDLHWHLLEENCDPDDDLNLWQHIQPININNFSTNTLDATDHLMHICVHGLRWNSLVPIRWVVDAKIIIDQNEIEWKRLIEEAKKREVILPVLYAFNYLLDEFSVPIPEEVLSKLSTLKLNKIEYYNILIRQGKHPKFSGTFSHYSYWYLRYSRIRSPNKYSYFNLGTILDFLKAHWELNSTNQIPGKLIRRGIDKIKRSYR